MQDPARPNGSLTLQISQCSLNKQAVFVMPMTSSWATMVACCCMQNSDAVWHCCSVGHSLTSEGLGKASGATASCSVIMGMGRLVSAMVVAWARSAPAVGRGGGGPAEHNRCKTGVSLVIASQIIESPSRACLHADSSCHGGVNLSPDCQKPTELHACHGSVVHCTTYAA
jgi:hypothetical protein